MGNYDYGLRVEFYGGGAIAFTQAVYNTNHDDLWE